MSVCRSVCQKKKTNFLNVRILGKCRLLLLLLKKPSPPQLHFHWKLIVLVINIFSFNGTPFIFLYVPIHPNHLNLGVCGVEDPGEVYDLTLGVCGVAR